MKIFWSWQSDTHGKTGRHFIRDVLLAAVAELKTDIALEDAHRGTIHLDHDQEGLTGSFDLAREILGKIDASEFFVADVTSIGTVDPAIRTPEVSEKAKRLINSNVAIELGYAYHAIDNSHLFLVMNDHYGDHEDLPFDLRHKGGTVAFTLPPDAPKAEIDRIAKTLQKRFVKLMKDALTNKAQTAKAASAAPPPPFSRAPVVGGPGLYFRKGEILASAGDPGEQEFTFKEDKAAYLRLFPTHAVNPIGLAKVVQEFDYGRAMPMSDRINGVKMRNKFGAITFDFHGRGTLTAFTQGFPTGELWGINGIVLRPHKVHDVDHTIIPIITLEKVFVKTLRNYVAIFTQVYGFIPPFTVVMGITGLVNAYLTAPGGPTAAGQQIGPIYDTGFESTEMMNSADDAALKDVLRKFFSAFYDLSARPRDQILTDQVVAAHDLPPR